MANIRKFMFDLDFSPQAPHKEEPEVVRNEDGEPEEDIPPPPMFTEDDLNLARDSAYEEGRRQGEADAAASLQRQIVDTLAALGARLGEAMRQQAEANDEAMHGAVRVAKAVLAKVLPAACETNAFEEVSRVVEEVMGHVLDEPRIIVRVADSMVEPVRIRLEETAHAHGFEGRVVVQPDARVVLGDCKVEWTDGGAERDQARLLAEINATIDRALAPPERRVEADSAAG